MHVHVTDNRGGSSPASDRRSLLPGHADNPVVGAMGGAAIDRMHNETVYRRIAYLARRCGSARRYALAVRAGVSHTPVIAWLSERV